MVSIAQKIVRAFLVGMSIGFVAGLGFYFMAIAINMLSGTTTFNPIAILIFVFGFILISAIAIEMSADIASKQNAPPTK